MENLELISLLKEIEHIAERHKIISKITGENFNIFKVLDLESSEVRLHSAFIAELLNPQGSHGQDDLFLKLFIEQFTIKSFDTKSAIVEVEKYIGKIDKEYTKGGRIDIALTDINKNQIFIENKIYASDQKNQLERYHAYNKEAKLFYLTLEVENEGKNHKLDYVESISYKEDVLNWLVKCKKEAINLPFIRETLAQYINLIKKLTGGSYMDKMQNEIINMIIKDPKNAEQIQLANEALINIKTITEDKVFGFVRNILHKEEPIYDKAGVTIKVQFGEDYDGVNILYEIFNNGKLLNPKTEYANEYNKYKEGQTDGELYVNQHSFWYNPTSFNRYQRFQHLDIKEIVKIYQNDDNYSENFALNIIKQEKEIRKSIIKIIQKSEV